MKNILENESNEEVLLDEYHIEKIDSHKKLKIHEYAIEYFKQKNLIHFTSNQQTFLDVEQGIDDVQGKSKSFSY